MNEIVKRKPLNAFSVGLMNVVMVASLQMMTACAVYGSSLIIFYLIATLIFFVPSLMIIAELATSSPVNGGPYIWVERAFGKQWGFFAACIHWFCNLIWYPTIFSLIATCFAYLMWPELAIHKSYLFVSMLILFWGITFLNFCGIKICSWVSSISAIVGIMLPTLLLVVFGIVWLIQSNPIQTSFSLSAILPHFNDPSQMTFLTQIIISLVGIEMAFVHAGDIHTPHRTIPKSLRFSAVAVLMIVIAAPLAISIVIPSEKISIVAGLFDAFKLFFEQCGVPLWVYPSLLGLVFIGNCGHVTAWMLSATRTMQIASKECTMSPFLRKTNRFGAPVGILTLEAIIFSFVAVFFLFFETLTNAYWFLLIFASQICLLQYLLLFAAAVKIKIGPSPSILSFKISGGVKGTLLAAISSSVATIAAIVIGFFPPEQGLVVGGASYSLLLAGGIFVILGVPLLLIKKWLVPSSKKALEISFPSEN